MSRRLLVGLSIAGLLALGACASQQAGVMAGGAGAVPLSCPNSLQLTPTIDPKAQTIDLPSSVCVDAGLFSSGSIEWVLPPGYMFANGAACVTYKAISGWAGSFQPTASGKSCKVALWSVTSAEWTYGLQFQTDGISTRKWTCDPTIVNRDTGLLLKARALGLKCTVVP